MKSEETTATADWLEVFESVLNATRATFIEGKSSLWDYANPEHFSSLWKSLEDESVKSANRVLILWSQTPPDESLFPVSTAEHVSPLHWAACAAKKFPLIRVCVLDLNPAAHRSQYLYEHYLSCDKGRLSWLRVIQAAHFFGSESADGCFQSDTTPVGIETSNARLFPQIKSNRTLIGSGHFLAHIRNELTSPHNADGRHAIANVVAPMQLNPEALSSGHSRALNLLLRSLCDSPGNKPSLQDEYPGFNLGLLHISEPEFLLVDDQANHGWYSWLVQQSRRLFGVRKGKPVATVSLLNPDQLLSQVENCDPLPFRFRFAASEFNGQRPQVLLLDLRLFSGNSLSDEVRFLTRIVDVCTKHLAATKLDHTWHEKMREDIGVVRGWLNAPQRESPGHHVALTLLARLIALLDFSLPIIIFSSTGQTSILKHFALHPNIITDFEKPRFFAVDGATLVADTEAKLHRAIEKALGFTVARCKCQTLLNLPQPRGCAAHPSTHVELYVDETGKRHDPDFAVGGCFAVFNHPVNALAAANQFDETLYKNGVLYFNPVCFAPSHPIKRKRQPCDVELLHGLTESDQKGCCPAIGFVRVLANLLQPPLSIKGDLFDSDSADQRFNNALTALLEVFLFESLPLILGTKSLRDAGHVTVSIFVATRAPELLPAEACEVEYKYGHFRPGGGDQVQSFNPDDVAKLVRMLSDFHEVSPNSVRLLGVPLVYENPGFGKAPRHAERFTKRGDNGVIHIKTKAGWFPDAVRDAHEYLQRSFNMSAEELGAAVIPDYRALHYVADEVISGNNAQTSYASAFTRSIPGQFDGPFDYSVRDVSRYLDRGHIADALIALRSPPNHTPAGQVVPDSRLLAAIRCARNMEDLSIGEFSRIAAHCKLTTVAESKVLRRVEEIDPKKREVDSLEDCFTHYLQCGTESVFVSGVRSSDHFVTEMRKKLKRLCDDTIEGIDGIKIFQDYRGGRCAYLKCSSEAVAQNVAQQINKTSWGWKAQQCIASETK